jgi:hypothetical protein
MRAVSSSSWPFRTIARRQDTTDMTKTGMMVGSMG